MCSRIITRLAQTGPLVSEEFLPQPLQKVALLYPPADESRLSGIMGSSNGFDTKKVRAFVYAPRIERNTPALWPVMAFSAGNGFDNFRIRVALFFQASSHDDMELSAWSEGDGPWAVAWRFEPPEGVAGAHCYYHAQPISAWDIDSGRLPVALPLNESHPAFPLIAADCVGLLAAMLVSLYGHEWTKRFLGDRSLRQDILLVKDSLSGLRLLDG